MSTTKQAVRKLEMIVSTAQSLLEEVRQGREADQAPNSASKRIRRSGKELNAFRKMLKAERKKGVAVSELAKRHNISSAYIYQL